MERYTPPRYGRKISLDPEHKDDPDISIGVNAESKMNKEIPPGFTYAQPTQTNALPIILLILVASPYIKPYKRIDKTSSSIMDSDNPLDDSDAILDILSSIHPYLDPIYQDGINFIFGLSETRTILKSLLDGSYQTSRLLGTIESPINYQDRAIGIIKSLQPYISLENQTTINRILDVNNTLEELILRLRKFKEQEIETKDSKSINLTRVLEIIDIIKLIMPAEQQKSVNQISSILRIAESVELAQLLNSANNDDLKSERQGEDNTGAEGIQPSDNQDLDLTESTVDSSKDNKVENISKMLKSTLNPEQAESLDMIIKMAQLMSANSTEKKSAD